MRILPSLPRSSEPLPECLHECMHGVLNPYWRNAGDIGKEYLIIEYRCQSCGQHFDPRETYWLWLRAVDRLRDIGGTQN
jgi:hypothetical protein